MLDLHWLNSFLISLVALAAVSCGDKEEQTDSTTIALDNSVLDLKISDGLDDYVYEDTKVDVGLIDGLETRLLLQFPSFIGIYDEDIVGSSIANMQLRRSGAGSMRSGLLRVGFSYRGSNAAKMGDSPRNRSQTATH